MKSKINKNNKIFKILKVVYPKADVGRHELMIDKLEKIILSLLLPDLKLDTTKPLAKTFVNGYDTYYVKLRRKIAMLFNKEILIDEDVADAEEQLKTLMEAQHTSTPLTNNQIQPPM